MDCIKHVKRITTYGESLGRVSTPTVTKSDSPYIPFTLKPKMALCHSKSPILLTLSQLYYKSYSNSKLLYSTWNYYLRVDGCISSLFFFFGLLWSSSLPPFIASFNFIFLNKLLLNYAPYLV